jgi:hypothetical protein
MDENRNIKAIHEKLIGKLKEMENSSIILSTVIKTLNLIENE